MDGKNNECGQGRISHLTVHLKKKKRDINFRGRDCAPLEKLEVKVFSCNAGGYTSGRGTHSLGSDKKKNGRLLHPLALFINETFYQLIITHPLYQVLSAQIISLYLSSNF